MNVNRGTRFSQLETLWSVVRRAHHGTERGMSEARGRLLERYRGAAFRYLLGAVRDADLAEELTQEFALHFLRGDFRHAHPDAGRFRDYLRCSLARLVSRHRRRLARQPVPLPADLADLPANDAETAADDEAFLKCWRDALLAQAWDDLARVEFETGQPVFTVLRFRAHHPRLRSAEMAEQLTARRGKPLSAAAARQALRRAREKFSDLLLDAVIQSLDDPTHSRLFEELVELNLLAYCRPALQRRFP